MIEVYYYTNEELKAIREWKRIGIEMARQAIKKSGIKPHPKILDAHADRDLERMLVVDEIRKNRLREKK